MLSAAGGGLLAKDAYNKLGDIGDEARTGSAQIGQQGSDMASFKGYGVTGPVGSTQVGPDGSVNTVLNSGQQNQMDLYKNASKQMLGSAMGGAGNQQEIYDAIRAMQLPEEGRNQAAMQRQLTAQGRQGISTNDYGGTPEQLAMAKAQAEAQNSAAYEAYNFGQQKQMQDATLANQFQQQQYAPLQQQQGMFAAGGQYGAGLEDAGRRQAATLFSEANMGGLDAQLAAGLGQANLTGNLGSAMITGGMGMFNNAIANQGTGGGTGGTTQGFIDRLMGYIPKF